MEEFKLFNSILKVETELRSKAYFLDFTRRLYSSGSLGQLNQAYFADDVHLSASGAQIVARAIHRHISFLPK